MTAALSRICIRLTSGRLSDIIFAEMVSGYMNALPLLSEEDVPDASFVCVKVKKHTVYQLRRSLACHGIKTLGNKTALLDRKAL